MDGKCRVVVKRYTRFSTLVWAVFSVNSTILSRIREEFFLLPHTVSLGFNMQGINIFRGYQKTKALVLPELVN